MKKVILSVVVLSTALLLCCGGITDAQGRPREEDTVTINLHNVEWGVLLKQVARELDKTVLVPPEFDKKSKVSVIGDTGVGLRRGKQFKDDFLSLIRILLSMGKTPYTIEETDKFIRIVMPDQVSPRFVSKLGSDAPYEYVALIHRFKFIDIKDSASSFRSLLQRINPKVVSVTVITESNSIVVRGNSYDVAKFQKMVEFIDQEIPTLKIETRNYTIQYYPARELEKIVRDFVQKLKPSSGASKAPKNLVDEHNVEVIFDSRGGIITMIGYKASIEAVVSFVKSVDLKIPVESRLRLYSLKNAKAEKLEPVLKALFTQTPKTGAGAPARDIRDVVPVIVAVKENNAILVNATKEDHDEIANLVEMLDKERYQVFIEAYIVEMSNDKMREIGVELATLDEPGEKVRGFGGTFMGLSSLDPTAGRIPIPPSGGLLAGIWRNTAGKIPLILALSANEGEAKVLASPFIRAYDNEKAVIRRSQEIPYETQIVDSSGRVIGSQTSGFYTAKLELEITPNISNAENLNLDIKQTVEQFFRSGFTERPAKTSSYAATYVSVPSGKPIIIGGLSKISNEKTVQKVPFFGDIPVFKWLFSKTKKSSNKTSLYIFITPHIIKDQADQLKIDKEYGRALELLKLERESWNDKKKRKSSRKK